MATDSQTLRITNKAHEGYRRAGVAFAKGLNDVALASFTKDQLAALQADPRLVTEVLDEAPADETGAASGAVDPGGMDSSLNQGMEKLLALVEADALELNGSGKPNADVLGVSAKERDQIWSDYLDQQVVTGAE